jgi:hypothetical protein
MTDMTDRRDKNSADASEILDRVGGEDAELRRLLTAFRFRRDLALEAAAAPALRAQGPVR